MSTYQRRAHTRTVNGKTVHVRASKPITARGGRDRQAADAREADPDYTPPKKYRRSTWVGATGLGLVIGGGRMMSSGLESAGAITALTGFLLVFLAAMGRLIGLALQAKKDLE